MQLCTSGDIVVGKDPLVRFQVDIGRDHEIYASFEDISKYLGIHLPFTNTNATFFLRETLLAGGEGRGVGKELGRRGVCVCVCVGGGGGGVFMEYPKVSNIV